VTLLAFALELVLKPARCRAACIGPRDARLALVARDLAQLVRLHLRELQPGLDAEGREPTRDAGPRRRAGPG